LPQRCVSCGDAGALLCPSCAGRIKRLTPPLCARCGAPTAWPVSRCRECSGRRLAFDAARSAVAYEGPVRPLVRAWKEHAARRAVDIAATLVVAQVERPAADVIAYIPPDPVRQLERSRHPAPALARALSSAWGIETAPLLARARPSTRQTGRGRTERLRGVRGAFEAPRPVDGRVVLVDDVYTTGATADAAVVALRTAGAASVEVVSFARTVR
jgi:predicted amidophosphoribosyltransferase